MIKELFFPTKIKNYYLFPRRIIGFDIGKTHISACQIYVRGSKTIIEKYAEEKLEAGNTVNYNERVEKALKSIVSRLDKYDSIVTSLSSSVIIFKELRLPFVSYDKIKMVINYEIEPLLPFSVHEAMVDFIITKTYPEESTSEILVAAVQKQHIVQHLQLFQNAGLSPDVITIDLFALYGLYKKMPQYASLQGNVVLIDLGLHATRIAFIQDERLRFIRTLPKGTFQVAKTASDVLGIQPTETIEYIIRYGLERGTNIRLNQALIEAITNFWQEIQLTLQSFTVQASQQQLTKIILLGGGSEIKGIADFVGSQLQTPCELMHVTDILHDPHITIKNKTSLPGSSIISLSTAIPSPLIDQVNLRQGEFAQEQATILTNQLLTALILLIMLMSSLAVYSFFTIRTLRHEAQASEQEVLNALKKRSHFEAALREHLKNVKEKNLLPEAVRITEDAVKQQEEQWFAFAGPARASMLNYLLALTTLIDKEQLGFSIESLKIADGVMKIKASVKEHKDLGILERSLQESKLFKNISSPQETTFTMLIGLAKGDEE